MASAQEIDMNMDNVTYRRKQPKVKKWLKCVEISLEIIVIIIMLIFIVMTTIAMLVGIWTTFTEVGEIGEKITTNQDSMINQLSNLERNNALETTSQQIYSSQRDLQLTCNEGYILCWKLLDCYKNPTQCNETTPPPTPTCAPCPTLTCPTCPPTETTTEYNCPTQKPIICESPQITGVGTNTFGSSGEESVLINSNFEKMIMVKSTFNNTEILGFQPTTEMLQLVNNIEYLLPSLCLTWSLITGSAVSVNIQSKSPPNTITFSDVCGARNSSSIIDCPDMVGMVKTNYDTQSTSVNVMGEGGWFLGMDVVIKISPTQLAICNFGSLTIVSVIAVCSNLDQTNFKTITCPVSDGSSKTFNYWKVT